MIGQKLTRKIVIAICFLTCMGWVSESSSHVPCLNKGDIEKYIENTLGATLSSVGISTDGALVQLFENKNKGFMLIITPTHNEELSCPLVEGTDWYPIEVPVENKGNSL